MYKGNYDQFDQTRSERLKNQLREYEAQKQYREHIQVVWPFFTPFFTPPDRNNGGMLFCCCPSVHLCTQY